MSAMSFFKPVMSCLCVAGAAALALGACSSSSAPGSGEHTTTTGDAITSSSGRPDASPDTTAPDAGPAADAHAEGGSPMGALASIARNETWTFVPFTDALCANGSTTGIGVNLTTASDDVMIFLQPGGACWDEATCAANCAINLRSGYDETHGTPPWSQFSGAGALTGSIFDRTDMNNPLRTFNFISVFYCTADVHTGTRVDTSFTIEDRNGNPVAPHFYGYKNLQVFLKAITATFPHPSRVVLAGQSAGGFGSYFDYDLVAGTYSGVPVYMIDDSGPVFTNGDTPPGGEVRTQEAWGTVLPSDCTGCSSDAGDAGPSALATYLSAKYPNGRMAVLSSIQDDDIRQRYDDTASQFTTGLATLAKEVLIPLKNWRYFFIAGDTHTMLHVAAPIWKTTPCGEGVTSAPGVTCAPTLEEFLNQEINGTAAEWQSAAPPHGVDGPDGGTKDGAACMMSQ